MDPNSIVAATETLYQLVSTNPRIAARFAEVERSRYNQMMVHVLSGLGNIDNMDFVVNHFKKTHRHMHIDLAELEIWVECLVLALQQNHVDEEHVRAMATNARTVFKSAMVDLLIDTVYAAQSATGGAGIRELTPHVESRLVELQAFLSRAFPAAQAPALPSAVPPALAAYVASVAGGPGSPRVASGGPL